LNLQERKIDMFSIKVIQDGAKIRGQYIALSKKLPAEIANKDAKDVGIQAIKLTKFATKEQIATDLNQPSRANPNVSIATILDSKAGGNDPEAYIEKRKTHNNVCRIGWKPGVDVLTKAGAKGGFTPRLRSANGLGDAKPALVNSSNVATATIWNNYGEGIPQVTAVQTEGLSKAEQAVLADREVYVKRKLEEIASATFGH
jgi:hypothetical protein